MQDQSSILSLPLIQPSQAQKHVTHNEALLILDALTQLAVTDRDRTAPPEAPETGDRHIVAAGAIGAWTGAEGRIALWQEGAWVFLEPRSGWRAEVLSEQRSVVFDGTAWVVRLPELDNLPGLGVNAAPDATNRLAVAAPATLLNHEGAGHRLKINKADPTDTASLLFQTGFSGRAEMGLAGGDDWSIKVSADGSTWTEALVIGGETGLATGAAIQSGPGDVTPGRLARADLVYGAGNLLGAVSEAGGAPTGAVIERGSNANGDYLRLADGTQICWHRIDMGAITQTGSGTSSDPYRTGPRNWTFPAEFGAATPRPVIVAQAEYQGPLTDARRVVSTARGLANRFTLFNLQLFRWAGFADADSYAANVIAVGRWF